MSKTLLIDGDIIVYKAGFSGQKTYYSAVLPNNQGRLDFLDYSKKRDVARLLKESGFTEFTLEAKYIPEDLSYTLHKVKLILESIFNKYPEAPARIFLTSDDKSNFRYQIAKTAGYKANRSTKARPVYYTQIRDYLLDRWHAELIGGQEADDAIGIASQEYPGTETIICSIDKDLDMLEGYHYHINTGKTYFVSSIEGYRNFCKQLLMGDVCDNIKGIRGIGPKTADKLLPFQLSRPDLLEIVRKQYQKAFKEQAETRLLENGQLLWIRRNEGELWNPDVYC